MINENKPRKGYKLVKWLFGKEIEIPEEWKIKSLKEIGEIIGGGTPDSTKNEFWNGKILWAVPTDITKLQVNQIEDTERNITQEGLDNSSANLLPKGTILITTRATIGKCAITIKLISTNQGFQNIICNETVDNYFTFYLINQFHNNLLRLSQGTTFLEINKSQMKKVIVPIPPLSEQTKIASILSDVDALIQNTTKIIEKSTTLKKGLMQKLLIRGIGHTKFKKVPWMFGKYEKIPEDWELESTSEILKITMGQSPPSESYNQDKKGLPFYQGVTDFGDMYPDPTIWCTDSRKIGEENSILFSVRAPVGEINLTKTKCCLGRGIAALSTFENNLLYCYYLLNQNKKRFLVYAQGTTYDAINHNNIADTKLPHTKNTQEQQKIASILSGVDAKNIANHTQTYA